ncbi:hypothetical protein D9Q98_007248 [Chlorella vulgaris]|uniref:Uncharacterized protein n=1 Tax=Chlorella vulgaris TaxID=3077 RepID=A0A9D4TKU7_CHLVU|nr:hypothetical protein D9Q98_007248 [Chlorella vulgaris]
MRASRLLAALLLLAAAGQWSAAQPASDKLCFSELQVLGSHNSYHQAPPAELLAAFGGLASGPLLAWEYTQPPLSLQLDAGVRALELDVYWDPQGRLYGQSAGLRIAGMNGWLTEPQYQQPGFKVLHIPDFDYRTRCILLSECLDGIRQWSDAHPGHLPIQLHLEVKDGPQAAALLGDGLAEVLQGLLNSSAAEGPASFVQPLQSTPQLFFDLQAELKAAFGGSTADGGILLTPDDVRAAVGAAPAADLQQILLTPAGGAGSCPWPSLSSMRGRVLVKLIQYGGSTLAAALQQAYPNLAGSLAWVERNGEQPLEQAVFRAAAIGRLQDAATAFSFALPANATAMVGDLVGAVESATAEGYLVRARADVDTVEARAGFVVRRDAILASGAQVVASDYVLPAVAVEPLLASGTQQAASSNYSVQLPGGLPGRCLRPSGSSSGGSSGMSGSSGDVLEMYGASGGSQDAIFCGPLYVDASTEAEGASGAEGGTAGSQQAPPVVEAAADSPGSAGGTAAAPQPQPGQQSAGASSGGVRRSLPTAASLAAAAAATLAAAVMCVA